MIAFDFPKIKSDKSQHLNSVGYIVLGITQLLRLVSIFLTLTLCNLFLQNLRVVNKLK